MVGEYSSPGLYLKYRKVETLVAILDYPPGAGGPGRYNEDPRLADYEMSLSSLEWVCDSCDCAEETAPAGRILGARLPAYRSYGAIFADDREGNGLTVGTGDDYLLLDVFATEEVGDYALRTKYEVTMRHILPDGSARPQIDRLVLSTHPTDEEMAGYSVEVAERIRVAMEDAAQSGWFRREYAAQCLKFREQNDSDVLAALEFEPQTAATRGVWVAGWAERMRGYRRRTH